jgi:vacuolar-type H+-ATPase subunit H
VEGAPQRVRVDGARGPNRAPRVAVRPVDCAVGRAALTLCQTGAAGSRGDEDARVHVEQQQPLPQRSDVHHAMGREHAHHRAHHRAHGMRTQADGRGSVEDMVNGVRNRVEEWVPEARDKAEAAIDRAEEEVKSSSEYAELSHLVDVAKDKAQDAAQGAEENAKDWVQNAKDKAASWSEEVKNGITKAVDKVCARSDDSPRARLPLLLPPAPP